MGDDTDYDDSGCAEETSYSDSDYDSAVVDSTYDSGDDGSSSSGSTSEDHSSSDESSSYSSSSSDSSSSGSDSDESASYDTSSSDTSSSEAPAYEAPAYETASYDATSYETASVDTASYETAPVETYGYDMTGDVSEGVASAEGPGATETADPAPVGADSGGSHVCAGPECCGTDAPLPTDLVTELGDVVTGSSTPQPTGDVVFEPATPVVTQGPSPLAEVPPATPVTPLPVAAAPGPHVRLDQVVEPGQEMVNMGGNNAGYVSAQPTSGVPAATPPGAEVVGVDAAGRPTHVRLDQVVQPRQEIVNMGNNNPLYIGTQSATGDPAADPTHVVSSTPVTPGVEWVTFAGQPARGIRPEDYPAPGSAAEFVARRNLGLLSEISDATNLINTGVDTIRDADGNALGYQTSNGNIYPTSGAGYGNALNQADHLRGGEHGRDTGPTIN